MGCASSSFDTPSTITDGYKTWDKVPGCMGFVETADFANLQALARSHSPAGAPGSAVDVKGQTLLHFAIQWYAFHNVSRPPVADCCKVISALIEAGVPVDAVTAKYYSQGILVGGQTALHLAVKPHVKEFEDLLLSHGATATIKNAWDCDVAAWKAKELYGACR